MTCTTDPVNAAIRRTSRQVARQTPLPQMHSYVPSTVSVRLAIPLSIESRDRKHSEGLFVDENRQKSDFRGVLSREVNSRHRQVQSEEKSGYRLPSHAMNSRLDIGSVIHEVSGSGSCIASRTVSQPRPRDMVPILPLRVVHLSDRSFSHCWASPRA